MNLLDRFRPQIAVTAEGEDLVFRRQGTEVRQQPLVRVASDGKITEVGYADLNVAGGQLLRLFQENGTEADVALRTFCRRQIALVLGASFALRPRLLVHEAPIRRSFGSEAIRRLEAALVHDGFRIDRAIAT